MSEIAEKVINEIVEFNEFDAQLAEFKSKYDDVVYDLTVPEEEKQARSDRLTIGKVIASLDRKHKELKAPLKARTDLIDGERKRIKDDLLNVQEKIKSQIQQHEDAIREHAEKLQSMVEEIRAFTEFDPYQVLPIASEQVQERLDAVNQVVVDDSYEDRKADATLAQVDAIKRLEALLAERLKYEEEQAELERLRKEAEERKRQEEHEQIRKEAEARAKAEAEKALEDEKRKVAEAEERGRQQAIAAKESAERAEKEAALMAEKAAQEAWEKADREFKDALAKEAAKVEQQRQADEAKKSKQAHRNKIHKEAKQSFIDAGYTDEQATKIVTLIKDGNIQHITISY